MSKKMTKKEALATLSAGKGITTGMLPLLKMTFETWLKYSQASPELQKRAEGIAKLILGEPCCKSPRLYETKSYTDTDINHPWIICDNCGRAEKVVILPWSPYALD